MGIWTLSLLIASLAAAFGVYQVYVFFDRSHPEFYWSRTIAALVAVALGSAGPAMPLLLILRRTAFMRMPTARQCVALVLLPVGYVAAFGSLLDLARQSLPFYSTTQTMLLRHAADDEPPLDLGIPGGMSGRGHFHGNDSGELVAEWEYWWLPATLREQDVPSDLQVTYTGPLSEAGNWEFTIDVTSDREIVFDVDGFADVSATRDGESVLFPLLLEPGTQSIVLNARPE